MFTLWHSSFIRAAVNSERKNVCVCIWSAIKFLFWIPLKTTWNVCECGKCVSILSVHTPFPSFISLHLILVSFHFCWKLQFHSIYDFWNKKKSNPVNSRRWEKTTKTFKRETWRWEMYTAKLLANQKKNKNWKIERETMLISMLGIVSI